MEPCRVLIVSEPGLYAQAISTLLQADKRFEIVGLTGDLSSATDLIRQYKPAVLLIHARQYPAAGIIQEPLAVEGIPVFVSLTENDNQMRIHRYEEHTLTAPEELIAALLGAPRPNRTLLPPEDLETGC